jgi:hypothetical protein
MREPKMQRELDPIAERSVCQQIIRLLDAACDQHIQEAVRLTEWLLAKAPGEERYQAAHLDALKALEALRAAKKKLG